MYEGNRKFDREQLVFMVEVVLSGNGQYLFAVPADSADKGDSEFIDLFREGVVNSGATVL